VSEQAEKSKPKAVAHPIDTKAVDQLSKKQAKKKKDRELAAKEKVCTNARDCTCTLEIWGGL